MTIPFSNSRAAVLFSRSPEPRCQGTALELRAAGTPGMNRSPRPPAREIKCRRGLHRRKPETFRRPARGWVTAYFARPPVDLPIYPPLDASSVAPSSVGTGTRATAKRGRSGERQARRSQATSAAARRVRYARTSQPPLPIRAPNTPRDAPLVDRDARIIGAQERAGIKFFADSRKGLSRKRKSDFGKSEFPRFAFHCLSWAARSAGKNDPHGEERPEGPRLEP
jgi:hypothetical protein